MTDLFIIRDFCLYSFKKIKFRVLTFTLSSVNQHSGWTYLKNSLGFIRISMETSENVW